MGVPEILQYGFMIRALLAGLVIGLVCPLIGVFLVLRRYSLMADALSHVALAGIGFGLLLGIHPGTAALFTAAIGALGIEELRTRRKLYGDAALALFLSGSLAAGTVLASIAGGFSGHFLRYLFGSIVTITAGELLLLAGLGIAVLVVVALLYKELFYISFDEESAAVSGLPVGALNTAFILVTAFAVSIALRVIGVLLVGALMVIPVISAMQVSCSFRTTVTWSSVFGTASTLLGLIGAFYLDLPPGGTVVLATLAVFIGASAVRGLRRFCPVAE